MDGIPGSLSNDGRWIWDGARWLPALSPDGRWRWDGTRWISVFVPRPPFWQPPWVRRDAIAVAVWLTLVPAALAVGALAVGLLAHVSPVGGLIATVTAYSVWSFIGGATVRPHARWLEVLLVAGALVALIALVDVVALMADDQPGNDDGAAVGVLFLVVFVFPLTVLPVALGRLTRRALTRAA